MNADAGCVSSKDADKTARAPICVKFDLSEPGNEVAGVMCIRCLNSQYDDNAANTDKGCNGAYPICIGDDLTEVLPDEAGTSCIKCINDNGATLGGGQDLGCTGGAQCARMNNGQTYEVPLFRRGSHCI